MCQPLVRSDVYHVWHLAGVEVPVLLSRTCAVFLVTMFEYVGSLFRQLNVLSHMLRAKYQLPNC